MKKIIILLLLFITVPAQAEVLTGGVKYSVEDAKIELFAQSPESSGLFINSKQFY